MNGKTLVQSIYWPDGMAEHRQLRLGADFAWQRRPDGWVVTLPESEVMQLVARLPSRQGLEFEGPGPAAKARSAGLAVAVRARGAKPAAGAARHVSRGP